MNRVTLFSLAAAASVAVTLSAQTQAPVQVAVQAQTPAEALQALKARNQKLLEQQNATLQKLEVLQKEAHQLRILARRT